MMLLISLVLCFFMVIEANVVVQTSSGKIAGLEIKSIIENEKFYSFMGIPYAEPPIGKLRFMPPKPHKGWTEVLQAKKEKPPCAQYFITPQTIKNYGFCGSEDCLHLSVHTPKLPTEEDVKLPVIVFFYNEAFKTTYNASKDYGPDFFMKEDVIFVTINHRIGSLGFLSFEDDLLPGNNGLRDVISALNWLQTNIHNFGGDPKRITLMGSQDGAALIDTLLHVPKAKGLFAGVILQSGTSWNSKFFGEKPRERAIALSNALDEEATTSSFLLKRLADVSAEKLTEHDLYAVHADEARAIQRGVVPFGPVVEHKHEDALITELPNGKPVNDVPIMIGYNSREGIEVSERYFAKPQFLTFADRDFLLLFPIRVNYHFEINSEIYMKVIEEIKNFYFEEDYVKVSRPGEYVTYIGDILTFYPIDYTVRTYTNTSNSNVYYYVFDYSGELNIRKKNSLREGINIDETWGASAGDELCYLFVCQKIRKSYRKAMQDEDSEEIKVLRNMVRMWTNFAKTGNPTPPGENFIWKPSTKENKDCLVISDELEMKTDLHAETVTFWDELLLKYQKKAVNGVVKDINDEL